MTSTYNTSAPTNTEAADIAELGKQAAISEVLDPGKIYSILDGDGGLTVEDTDKYAARPRRKTSAPKVTDAQSFKDYLEKHGIEGETEVTAQETEGCIISIIDAGTDLEPGWRDHTITLQLQSSDEWRRWLDRNNKLMRQVDFAEFIEDNAKDILEPSYAEIFEIATSLQVKRGVDFESATRLDNGEIQLGYRETTTSTAGKIGQLSVPQTLIIALRPFKGGEPYRVTASFRYRLNGPELTMGYKLQNLEKIRDEAFATVSEEVRTFAEASSFLFLNA
ncbi:DUF2303 family protein [Arthrobacter sp. GMC3]|uniref:DUF2303 family protein n=1 Tax=Arthrobacter sp. GMC3 TaxID=2058894 RepID=UPI000CE3BF30|nr:DUF2303 family protein [Arthrobacter sp. GMC3]